MEIINQCPKCNNKDIIKGGKINEQQRYKCKYCKYVFTVNKIGKNIENQYVIKSLQLYLEGLNTREIEKLIGVSHVTISNWIKKYGINIPPSVRQKEKPLYEILTKSEIIELVTNTESLNNSGMIITEMKNKFIVFHFNKKNTEKKS